MRLEIIPTGAAVGAEISGVDLSQPIHPADFEALENAFNEHGVIFFRDQTLTPEQQLDFTRQLGDVAYNTFGESRGLPGCTAPPLRPRDRPHVV